MSQIYSLLEPLQRQGKKVLGPDSELLLPAVHHFQAAKSDRCPAQSHHCWNQGFVHRRPRLRLAEPRPHYYNTE